MTTDWMQPSDLRLTGAPTPAWTREHVGRIAASACPRAPRIAPGDTAQLAGGLVVWDLWPLARTDGRTAEIEGGELWFGLAAPRAPDPDARHDIARIHLLQRTEGRWTDLGPAMPDGLSPGAREWSGTAILRGREEVVLYFTAAGRRGDRARSFEQRLFQASAVLDLAGERPRLTSWSAPVECVHADGDVYREVTADVGEPGHIKAMRDPAFFHDPADGADYLCFAASLGRSRERYDGMIGLARAQGQGLDRWTLEPPLLHADGVNNEMERPAVLVRDGLYYVFWCTQRQVFAPGVAAPTGLYGVVGSSLRGPFRPLNGSGLVFANPVEAPKQAYAWWVTGDGCAWGFVDEPAVGPGEPPTGPRPFAGVPAPPLSLRFDGDRVTVEG